MGNHQLGGSKPKPDALIEAELKKQQERANRVKVIKLLLYGPGECGKTTVLRQVQLINGGSLAEQRKQYRGLICFNVIEGAAFAIRAANKFNIPITVPEVVEAANIVTKYYDYITSSQKSTQANLNDPMLRAAIQVLHDDATFRHILSRSHEFQLPDGWHFFADQLQNDSNWGGPGWSPSDQDLLHSRIRTTGKNDTYFTVDNVKYQLIDVGGQQSERKKFFNLFSQVDAVLFVASLSEYDQKLFEDDTTNRLTETLQVWDNVVNHKDFSDTWFVLYLNKFDLLQKKFYREQKPIVVEEHVAIPAPPPLPTEEVDARCAKVIRWYESVFLHHVKPNKRSQVVTYVTSALDKDSISRVMDLCASMLMSKDVGTFSAV